MSEAAFESEAYEAYEAIEGEAEAAGEALEGEASGEAGWGEGSREDARRRRLRQQEQQRQRQIMMARQAQQRRQLPAPAGRPPAAAPSQAAQSVRSEVRSLDLDTKVALDSIRSRLNEAQRLAYRNAWAAEASVAASQVLDSFEISLEPHDWARALIRGAPTLLLASGKPRKPGLEGLLMQPQVGGTAVLAAIFAFGHFRNAPAGADSIVISRIPANELNSAAGAGGGGRLTGTAVDKQSNPITRPITITFDSEDQSVLQVRPDGTFTPLKAGPTRIIATGGGTTVRQDVTVT